MQYLGKSIKYPTIAQETGTQGRVIVQFVVNKDEVFCNVSLFSCGISLVCWKSVLLIFRFGEQIFPKVRVYGARSVSGLPVAGVNMRDVISIAFGPDTRIIPMAPPWAVAMAQIVSWFIIFIWLII